MLAQEAGALWRQRAWLEVEERRRISLWLVGLIPHQMLDH